MEIKRDLYLEKLIVRRGNGLVKIITGMRRCGKSYLLFRLFKNYLLENGILENHIIGIELDNITNTNLRDGRRLYDYIVARITDNTPYVILLDEVQLVPHFEEVLCSLLHIANADVYVTGSNSKFLSTDIVTEFRGRGDEVRIFPLSFKEFMSVYPGDQYKGWYDYTTYGGLPQLLSYQTEEQKREYLRSIVQTTYLKDLIDRYRIRHKTALYELCQVLASSMASLTNPTNLEKAFTNNGTIPLSRKTIDSYIAYMEDAFLIHRAKRYDVKGKHYINTLSKFYFADPGIRNAILDFRQLDEGHLMEQVLYLELLKKGFRVDVGMVEKRITMPNGTIQKRTYEVDFIADKQQERLYIQSSYQMPSSDKIAQELNSLNLIHNAFSKMIITHEPVNTSIDEQGIATQSVFNFLL